ncbi:MAG TPA: glutamate racemase [Thermoanaerobaculia bacterium]|nr:glutamate racemase [Thermoanaerobaculia bacterium]
MSRPRAGAPRKEDPATRERAAAGLFVAATAPVSGRSGRGEAPARRVLGVFDSGVGGLTVVARLRQELPGVDLVYLGDTARLPYGTKSPATVARYTRRNVAFLVERGVDGVVVACNSASAMALEGLEAPVPVWGVIEPGARAAALASRGRIGVLATASTVASGAYPRAVARIRPDLEVAQQACPLFVPLVEEGWIDDPVSEAIARRYLEPLLARGVDTLVLGCTHYPLLAPLLRRVVGEEVRLVDSAQTVSAVVAAEFGAEPGGSGSLRLLVTDCGPGFERLARRIVGDELDLELVDVPAREASGERQER